MTTYNCRPTVFYDVDFWAGGVAVSVITNFFKNTFISWVIRDKSFGKMEVLFQKTIGFNGIKRGIA